MKIRSKVLGSSIGAAVAATGFVGLAQADEYAAPRARYVAPDTWSGYYGGASVGGAWSSFRNEWPVTDEFFLKGSQVNLDPSGVTAGIHAGLQHQWGGIVAGVELAASTYHQMDASADFRTNPPCTVAVFSGNTNITDCGVKDTVNWSAQAVGRLGIAAGPILPYVKGGIAVVDITSREVLCCSDGAVANPFANPFFTARDEKVHPGWVVGGGLEWKVAKQVVLGVDYQHIFVNDGDHSTSCVGGSGIAGACPFGFTTANVRVNGDIDSVSARLSFLFGREPLVPLK